LFLLSDGSETKNPKHKEKKIEIKDMKIVTNNPSIKKRILDKPSSRLGFKTYHPHV
tara:strand:+ start:127 stop:294 length:168 start_codon:yes stop_codon:yes gene_type:complete